MEGKEKSGNAVCDLDCLHCRHDDCISDEYGNAENTDAYVFQKSALEKREKERARGREKYRKLRADPEKVEKRREINRRYMEKNKDKYKLYWHQYYLDHRERYLELAKRNRARRREKKKQEGE